MFMYKIISSEFWCEKELTISGTPMKHNDRVIPNSWAMGRIAKLPTTPPIAIDVATNVASSSVNGPVGIVVFGCWISTKCIVIQPLELPNENDSKLPVILV